MAGVVTSLFPTLTREEQRVSLQIYRLLAGGEPVPRDSIATAIEMEDEAVREILDRWPAVYYDDQNRIIGYWGLTLRPTVHRFFVDDRALYTWCAWDTLFIPQLVEKTARVESECPVTGEAIRLTVAPDNIKELQPADTVLSFVAPETAKIDENVVANFCHFVLFFSTVEAGSEWVAEHPNTLLLSVTDGLYLALERNKVRYPDVLKP